MFAENQPSQDLLATAHVVTDLLEAGATAWFSTASTTFSTKRVTRVTLTVTASKEMNCRKTSFQPKAVSRVTWARRLKDRLFNCQDSLLRQDSRTGGLVDPVNRYYIFLVQYLCYFLNADPLAQGKTIAT